MPTSWSSAPAIPACPLRGQLARAGASVLVLERERIGWGCKLRRNGGQVLTGLKLDPATLVAALRRQTGARRLFEVATSTAIASLETLIADEAIDCEYAQTGRHLPGGVEAGRISTRYREEQALLARVFEHPVATWSAIGAAGREIGTDAYHGLLVDERSGSLNPAKYMHGLAAAATRQRCEGP